MKGPKPIELPNYFSVEWYKRQKELGKTDIQIAEFLFISYATLHSWKRKIGWKSGEGLQFCGRKSNPHTAQIKKLREQGFTHQQIAAVFSICEGTVRNHLKR